MSARDDLRLWARAKAGLGYSHQDSDLRERAERGAEKLVDAALAAERAVGALEERERCLRAVDAVREAHRRELSVGGHPLHHEAMKGGWRACNEVWRRIDTAPQPEPAQPETEEP